MARILIIGKVGPMRRMQGMLKVGGHNFTAIAAVADARTFTGWTEYEVVLLGERLSYGERELIAELIAASGARTKLIFLYEFFIGNPTSADAIVDIALGFEYLPDAIRYVTREQGSIRHPLASAERMPLPPSMRTR